jgi:hypothetical protein
MSEAYSKPQQNGWKMFSQKYTFTTTVKEIWKNCCPLSGPNQGNELVIDKV